MAVSISVRVRQGVGGSSWQGVCRNCRMVSSATGVGAEG
jgi:hypothetical protein